MGIENKLKNAKTSSWLTDGLSDLELQTIKCKTDAREEVNTIFVREFGATPQHFLAVFLASMTKANCIPLAMAIKQISV